MSEVLTTCPYCGVGCNFYLTVEDGQVTGMRPSKGHPVNQGSLCPKGATAHLIVHHPDRLTVPLIRENGGFREVTWDEAYDRIVTEFTEIRDRYGGGALAVIASTRGTNEENYITQKFARAMLQTNNVENCSRICHSATAAAMNQAFGTGAGTNSIEDALKAKLILITGANPAAAHPIIWSNFIRKAVRNGTKLIVIDPRTTQAAKVADIHLQLKPGTNIALLNAMVHHIIEKDLVDHEFIASRTEGFEKLKQVVANYPPERAEEITGVPADRIRQAAELYATVKPAMSIHGIGMTEHQSGVGNVWSIANLAMITGNVGKEGSGVNPLRGQNNVQGAADMGSIIDYFPGYQDAKDPEVRAKFAKAWSVELPPIGSDPLWDPLWCSTMWTYAIDGQLRGMYIIGENVVVSEGNTNKVKKALESLDFLVVQDIFLTETAEHADVVLPAASYAEKDGTYTNTDRRVQRIRKAIEPIGNSKSDWEIICDLSEQMGYPMRYESAAEIMDEIASLVPTYAGISYERLEGYGLQWPVPDRNHPGTKVLHVDRFTRGTGIIRASEHISPAEEPDDEYPMVLTTGRTFMQYNSGSMTRRVPNLEKADSENFVELSQADAERYNVAQGNLVRVATRRGSVEVKARIIEIAEGVIWMPFHFNESLTNYLTNDAVDPLCGITELKACAARIEPID
ncbi:MAG: formate dehydrogenase subunit alpha [Candidatus Bipolaricaulia bacterium]